MWNNNAKEEATFIFSKFSRACEKGGDFSYLKLNLRLGTV